MEKLKKIHPTTAEINRRKHLKKGKIKNISQEDEKVKGKKKDKLRCPECKKKFKSMREISIRGIVYFHVYICEKCGKMHEIKV